MRKQSYERLEKLYKEHHGYVKTTDLLKGGFTNRQIAQLLEEGYLEKIANGSFWMKRCGLEKPFDYKPVETCLVNPEAVVIADSACFYQGLINVEPDRLSIATRRTDRHQMQLPFPVSRHYLAEDTYEEHRKSVITGFGAYHIYDIDRSVCDCIRFRGSIEEDLFTLIMERYRQEEMDRQRKERLWQYARRIKIDREAHKILE